MLKMSLIDEQLGLQSYDIYIVSVQKDLSLKFQILILNLATPSRFSDKHSESKETVLKIFLDNKE